MIARWKSRLVIAAITFGAVGVVSGRDEPETDSVESVLHYRDTIGIADPVARLQKRLVEGKARLRFESTRGYLPSLLKELRIPVSSQGLVFSKTSSQADYTTPRTPRAIYFADDVAVGWTPAAPVIDLAAVDPRRGTLFYTLEQNSEKPPRFHRDNTCLRCHLGSVTDRVPAMFVRSVYTTGTGKAMAQEGDFVSGHNSPLSQRWGGWYVSGTHANDVHLGNTFVSNPDRLELSELTAGGNLKDLRVRFDASRYLSPHSDIVALLVLEHEVRMHALITRANYETLAVLQELEQNRRAISATIEHPASGNWELPEHACARIALAGDFLLEYMLFRNESPLKGPVKGTTDFAKEFPRGGPRGPGGKSLRQLDLHRRLFRYPCSFLIYSPAFDALPAEMRGFLWGRLEAILTGKDQTGGFQNLTALERADLLAILHSTKPEFARWLAGERILADSKR